MTTLRLKNGNESQPVLPAPVHDDGTPYRWEMIHGGGARRAYADSTTELLDCLISEYGHLDPQGAATARLRYAVDIQVCLQAALATQQLLSLCTAEEKAVLLGRRDTPPSLTTWSAPIPLVLVTTFYLPTGPRARPEPTDGAEILWLDPTTELDLLASLHRVGVLQLAVYETAEAVVAPEKGH